MIISRVIVFAYFVWKVRNVNILFSDYAQNIRAGIIDSCAMVALSIVWIVLNLSVNSIIAYQFCYQVRLISNNIQSHFVI